jgi:hypothetical protein
MRMHARSESSGVRGSRPEGNRILQGAEWIRETAYPQAFEFAEQFVLEPSEESMHRLYEVPLTDTEMKGRFTSDAGHNRV